MQTVIEMESVRQCKIHAGTYLLCEAERNELRAKLARLEPPADAYPERANNGCMIYRTGQS